jgi:hypothetical protein
MMIDLGVILYIENAILTAGAILALIHRGGNTILEFKGEPDAPPPAIMVFFAAAFWPLVWVGGSIWLVARLINKLGSKQAA